MSLKNKLLCIFLAILIVLVNSLTLFHLLNNPRQEQLFGVPDKIVVSQNDKTFTIDPNHPVFSELMQLNEKRYAHIAYYTPLNAAKRTDQDLIMEYHFEKKHTFSLPLQSENKRIKTHKFVFILTGEHNSLVSFASDRQKITIGGLNTNADLIHKIQELLN